MSFTDQKPRVATEDDVKMSWGCEKNGRRFRCYLCGYKFKVGDGWRWVYAGGSGYINFMVCSKCDGDNVLARWIQMNQELKSIKERFWWHGGLNV